MILQLCVQQVDKYSFTIKDITTSEMYAGAGISLASQVTAATLQIKNLYDNSTTTINVLSKWPYILTDGATVNIVDLPNNTFGGYDYFPDYMYEFTLSYTYAGRPYSSSQSVGFRAIISSVVYQQLKQEDWKKTLGCGCYKASLSLRKFNYLKGLQYASENCLVQDYITVLLALYKLAGEEHDYS